MLVAAPRVPSFLGYRWRKTPLLLLSSEALLRACVGSNPMNADSDRGCSHGGELLDTLLQLRLKFLVPALE